jgi:hypothetical protein
MCATVEGRNNQDLHETAAFVHCFILPAGHRRGATEQVAEWLELDFFRTWVADFLPS